MIEKNTIFTLEERLLARRKEILDLANVHESEWDDLRSREQEIEEAAQKEALSQELAQLEGRERREIEAIDEALRRISLGDYGICESCGRDISLKRLEAIPFTRLCAPCAKSQEDFRNRGIDPERDRNAI